MQNVKKSMLEKMFPKSGSKFPEIRFKGFTEAWEQRKLSEVFSSYTDPVDIPHDGYERLGIRSHAKGTFHSYVPAGHELQPAQMHRVAANKFIVNITFGWEHAVAVTDENDAGRGVLSRGILNFFDNHKSAKHSSVEFRNCVCVYTSVFFARC